MSAKISWLASYPKSGNTWMRLVLSSLRDEGERQTHINDIKSGTIASDRTWIEEALGIGTSDLTLAETQRFRPSAYRWSAQRAQRGEIHKIHDACTQTDRGEWVPCPQASGPSIYLIRNPLDVALSYAAHSGLCVNAIISVMNSPSHCMAVNKRSGIFLQVAQELLDWSGHVTSWIDNAAFDVRVIRYEDMLYAPEKAFPAALDHLGIAYTSEQLGIVLERTAFTMLQAQEEAEDFRERSKSSDRFFRKGIAGDWVESLTEDQIGRIVAAHKPVMQRFDYCDGYGRPKVT